MYTSFWSHQQRHFRINVYVQHRLLWLTRATTRSLEPVDTRPSPDPSMQTQKHYPTTTSRRDTPPRELGRCFHSLYSLFVWHIHHHHQSTHILGHIGILRVALSPPSLLCQWMWKRFFWWICTILHYFHSAITLSDVVHSIHSLYTTHTPISHQVTLSALCTHVWTQASATNTDSQPVDTIIMICWWIDPLPCKHTEQDIHSLRPSLLPSTLADFLPSLPPSLSLFHHQSHPHPLPNKVFQYSCMGSLVLE